MHAFFSQRTYSGPYLMLEVNPIVLQIKDMQGRVNTLRGYL